MTTFTARPAPDGLHGRVRVPGDKSISHRSLMLAALAEGRTQITGLSSGLDVACTLAAIRTFGAGVEGDPSRDLFVDGGRERIGEPSNVIDVGNSGTSIRLLAGWAAGMDFLTVLQGDQSIARRPMERVTEPLRRMGAEIDGRGGGRYPPLVVRGGSLLGIDYDMPVPSAQVKSAILLAGLSAEGETTVRERVATRIHTEEMLRQCGASVAVEGRAVTVTPGPLHPTHFDVPGDPSQAAFWVVAACITPGSDLTVERVYVGPGRAGFVDVLVRMGADVELIDRDPDKSTAVIRARYSEMHGTDVGGSEVPALIDEIPVLAVAAAFAAGITTFRDAAELRVKESDRVASVVTALGALGFTAEGMPDGIAVEGAPGYRPAGGQVDSFGDHRVAMAAAVAALAGRSPVQISGWDAVATSYPRFEEDYERCAS